MKKTETPQQKIAKLELQLKSELKHNAAIETSKIICEGFRNSIKENKECILFHQGQIALAEKGLTEHEKTAVLPLKNSELTEKNIAELKKSL